MKHLQLFFNLLFIIGLFTAVVSGFFLWLNSRRLAKTLKENLPNYYTKRFENIKDQNKYKSLNQDLQNLISASENSQFNLKEEVKKIRQKYYLKEEFDEFLIMQIENYKRQILFWKKVGDLSVKITVIGAIISILFIITKGE